MKLDQQEIQTGEATYCPEDNKLRLYVGRVPREEFLALRAEGWKSTPKQDCDFVTTWTPQREDTALAYGEGLILDEDQSPADRAADRAERFGGYCDKRFSEAVGHADKYDAGPSAHGYQSEKRAQRAAARHDRQAKYALNAWDKAEYWQRRTAGVIQHALHVSSAGVRMGRIKTLEASQRKAEASLTSYAEEFKAWQAVLLLTDETEQHRAAYNAANRGGLRNYKHPRPETISNSYIRENGSSLFSLLTLEDSPITGKEAAEMWLKGRFSPDSEEFEQTSFARWKRHFQNRLSYENQMLEAQGGMLEQSEMEIGGTIGGQLIVKVNRSTKTKRITSAAVIGPRVEGYSYRARNISGTEFAEYQINTERLSPNAYKAPTDESQKQLADFKAAVKAAKAKKPKAPALINPTDEDAEKLQRLWNEKERSAHDKEEPQVLRMTQAQYSSMSKGAYARCESVQLLEGGVKGSSSNIYREDSCLAAVCKVRCNYRRVIILTDKPQKPLPVEAFKQVEPAAQEWCKSNLIACNDAITAKRNGTFAEDHHEAWRQLRRAKWASSSCWRSATVAEELQAMLTSELAKA